MLLLLVLLVRNLTVFEDLLDIAPGDMRQVFSLLFICAPTATTIY